MRKSRRNKDAGGRRWHWLRRLVPSPSLTEQRTSILSVRVGDARTFFALASTLWLVAAVRIGYNSVHSAATDWRLTDTPSNAARVGEISDVTLAAMAEFSSVVVGTAVVALLLTRPVNLLGGMLMTMYQAMMNRFVIPVIEAHKAEGRAEGFTQGLQEGREAGLQAGHEAGLQAGLEEGRATERTAWLAWNARRTEAMRSGVNFTEPPPGH